MAKRVERAQLLELIIVIVTVFSWFCYTYIHIQLTLPSGVGRSSIDVPVIWAGIQSHYYIDTLEQRTNPNGRYRKYDAGFCFQVKRLNYRRTGFYCGNPIMASLRVLV